MAWSLTVNGLDLVTTFGFCPNETDGFFDAPDRSFTELAINGRAGTLLAGPTTEQGRQITLTGTLTTTAKTVAALETASDQFKDAVRSGVVRLIRTSTAGTARVIDGVAKQIRLSAIGHPVSPTDLRVSIVFKCEDAYWSDLQPTSRLLGATRATLPLGTAPSTPIIRLMGSATSPVVTYRDAGGVAQKVATLTSITLAATNDWLDLDMRTGKITLSASGVVTNQLAQVTGDFPWGFDPQDGDYATSAWPTLEVSSGSGVAYWWKNWL